MSICRTVSALYLTLKSGVDLKIGVGVVQGHWNGAVR